MNSPETRKTTMRRAVLAYITDHPKSTVQDTALALSIEPADAAACIYYLFGIGPGHLIREHGKDAFVYSARPAQ